MIDNKEQIKKLLSFTDKDDFYQLYVFKRKKDQIDKDNHQSVRTIKTYCISSLKYLDERWDEITHLCEYFKARAYININKNNHKDISLLMLETLAKRIRNGNTNQKGLFDSIAGELRGSEKRWIVDLDTKNFNEVDEVIKVISDLKPLDKEKIIGLIPTRQGYHLITERFDVLEFRKIYKNIDIQKHNPTLIYLPKSLESL